MDSIIIKAEPSVYRKNNKHTEEGKANIIKILVMKQADFKN